MNTIYKVKLKSLYYDQKNDRYIYPIRPVDDEYECGVLCMDEDFDLVVYDRIYLTGKEIAKMNKLCWG